MKKVIALLFLSFFSIPFFSQSVRGLQRLVDTLDTDITAGNQYVFIIAINKYRYWAPLKNPVKDAQKIKEVLEKRYYVDKVIELYDEDATKGNIIKTFKDLQNEITVNDSLLIFYAGHGYYDEEVTKNAYWIPVDGGGDSVLQENWLPNSIIRGMISGIKSKHILLISDSCFSGDLLVAHRGKLPEINNEYLKSAFQKRSRQILTSGGSETVPDESSFTRQLLLALEENSRPFVDSLMLFDQIRLGVSGSTPMFGSLAGTDHQEGASFLLFLKDNSFDSDKGFESKKVLIEKTEADIEKEFMNNLSSILTDKMSLKELEESFAVVSGIISNSQGRGLKRIEEAGVKKIYEIKNAMQGLIRSDIEMNYIGVKKSSTFDPAIEKIMKYIDYERMFSLDNVSDSANEKIKSINLIKLDFERECSLKLEEIIKSPIDSKGDIDNSFIKIRKIETDIKSSLSKFENLESNIANVKETLDLKQSIFDIKENKEKFRKAKNGIIASSSVIMSLSVGLLGSGIASIGLNNYYGSMVDENYRIYRISTNQSDIDASYNRVIEYTGYFNGFLISGIANTVIGGILAIPAIILFANLSRESIYNREIENINRKIQLLKVGFNYQENEFNLSFGIKF